MMLQDAKQALAKLEALRAAQTEAQAQAQAEIDEIVAGLGEQMLNAELSGQGGAAVRADAIRRLQALQDKLDGGKSMLKALFSRLEAARRDLTACKADELEKRSAVIFAEVAERQGKLSALCQQIVDQEGAGSLLIMPHCKTEGMRLRAEAMQGAAVLLRAGRDCLIDSSTGRSFDADL